MFPFILAITCMLLVQFYSISFARKWRQEGTSYRSELFKHLLSHYDLIHRTTNTQSNYHEGNSFFGPLSKALEKNTRRGEEASFPLLPRARASSQKKTLAPALLFQKLWVIHVSQNRCQKAYLLRLQSSTANSPFSNSKLPLNTNINDTFKIKYSQILASKCLKFKNTQ